jgi:Rrf2 family protein
VRLTLIKETEYALRALVWLCQETESERAERPDGPPVRHKTAAISGAVRIPPVFAARVLGLLRRHGLLRARAGRQGGYTLARPAADVTLLQVIEAVEGPLETRTCVLRDSACGAGGRCVLHGAWSTAQEALRSVLGRTTLDSALRSGRNSLEAPPDGAYAVAVERLPARAGGA